MWRTDDGRMGVCCLECTYVECFKWQMPTAIGRGNSWIASIWGHCGPWHTMLGIFMLFRFVRGTRSTVWRNIFRYMHVVCMYVYRYRFLFGKSWPLPIETEVRHTITKLAKRKFIISWNGDNFVLVFFCFIWRDAGLMNRVIVSFCSFDLCLDKIWIEKLIFTQHNCVLIRLQHRKVSFLYNLLTVFWIFLPTCDAASRQLI